MSYNVPLLLNSNNEVTGVFAVHTSEGPLVVIFSSTQRLQEFMQSAHPLVSRDGGKVGSFEVEEPTVEDVVAHLIRMDPTLGGGSTRFIRDTDPFFDSILSYLRAQE